MNSLEETCVYHIKSMMNIVCTEEEIRCRNCSGYDTCCDNYKAYNPNTQISVRRGKVAYLLKEEDIKE